jgi:hypothetical protein
MAEVDNTARSPWDYTAALVAEEAATRAAAVSAAAVRYQATPADHGLLAWTFDNAIVNASSVFGTAGTLSLARLKVPVAITATTLWLSVSTAGTALTSGQCFAGLWTAAGARVGVTADQASAWGSTGVKSAALVGGPYALAAGDYYIGLWFNGTSVGFSRLSSSAGLHNVNLSAANSRAATADASLTTTAPATLGTKTANANYFWAALS